MNRKRTISCVALIAVISGCVALAAMAKKPVKPPEGPPTPPVTPGMVLIHATETSGDNTDCGYVDSLGNIFFSGGMNDGGSNSVISNSVMIGRLTSEGVFDTDFGEGGIVTTSVNYHSYATGCAPQSDGKIVLSGNTHQFNHDADWLVLGYNYDGSTNKCIGDSRCKRGGKVITDFDGDTDLTGGMAVQADDKIVVTGESRSEGARYLTTARYTADGFLDPSFGSGGIVHTSFDGLGSGWGEELAIHGDGVLVLGNAQGRPFDAGVLFRLDDAGNLDPFFGNGGTIIGDYSGWDQADFRDVAVDDFDGSIVVTGYLHRMTSPVMGTLVARYDEFGNPDPTFGDGSGYVSFYLGFSGQDPQAVAIQDDGKIVVAGALNDTTTFNMWVFRLNNDGTFDTTFGGNGWVTTSVADAAYGIDESYGYDVAIQDDGKIVVFGKAIDFNVPHMARIVRFNSDGSLDLTFND